MKTVTLTTLGELAIFAQQVFTFLPEKEGATVLALQGDLGVGKTALTKEWAKLFSITNEITSPTFVIMKSYPIFNHPRFKTLVHIDAYRIENEDEMRVLGFDELLQNPENLIVVEWPERIASLIPTDAELFHFALAGEIRTITYGD